MKKLLKAYNLSNLTAYYWMILESFQNGQKKQAQEHFLSMTKAARKEFVYQLIFEETSFSASVEEQAYFFDLL